MVIVILLVVVAVCIATVLIYIRQEKFGAVAKGERLERMRRSPNFKDGVFRNVHDTPSLKKGSSIWGIILDFWFVKHPRTVPVDVIPSVKTDLRGLDRGENVLVWFGHSSYFLQVEGVRILVDPVFSGSASPIGGLNSSFRGSDVYGVGDLPDLDLLIISHDHYDHLDYLTVRDLEQKVEKVICGLGVGAHLERWGYAAGKIVEKDWNEVVDMGNGLTIYTTPARHFSGRVFKRNVTLWMSMVLQTPKRKLFIGGDSGYDSHFAEIGNKFGPFDLAILENGQYNERWPYIHMLPDEVIPAAIDLKAKRIFPVHSSKFRLSTHSWDEPLIKVKENAAKAGIALMTPMIGERVDLDEDGVFSDWWVG